MIQTIHPVCRQTPTSYRRPACLSFWVYHFRLNGDGSGILKSVPSAVIKQRLPLSFMYLFSHLICCNKKHEREEANRVQTVQQEQQHNTIDTLHDRHVPNRDLQGYRYQSTPISSGFFSSQPQIVDNTVSLAYTLRNKRVHRSLVGVKASSTSISPRSLFLSIRFHTAAVTAGVVPKKLANLLILVLEYLLALFLFNMVFLASLWTAAAVIFMVACFFSSLLLAISSDTAF